MAQNPPCLEKQGHVSHPIDAMHPLFALYKECRLCPRSCGADRTTGRSTGQLGYCGESDQCRISYVGPHFGEEPPLTGKNGSGTLFFGGCTLKCSFCQNHQISHGDLAADTSMEQLLARTLDMVSLHQVHNVNLVSPDPFLPHALELIRLLRAEGVDLPVVFNCSGYEASEWVEAAGDGADIYLPDFKYADRSLSWQFSRCRDYPDVALGAIQQMIRQKGFLDIFSSGTELARKGVLVRHLILPGHVENSLDALTTLFLEFGPHLPLSLMSQYHPVLPQEDENLNRRITREEFDQVYAHVLDLGFENLFLQFPPESPRTETEWVPLVPDFEKDAPFVREPVGFPE